MTIKKIILSLIALTAMMSANAQVIDVYINDQLDTTYMNCTSRRNKVVFKSNDTESAADASYEQVDIYENGTLIKTYKNTADNVCKVVFRERDYVEIGGVKWATMNVGATTVADSSITANGNYSSYGDYYAWGEIETYYDSLTPNGINFGTKTKTHIPGKKTGYDWTNYCGSTTAKEWDPVPYSNGVLTSEHDAATYEWGSNWRMPTQAEYTKLLTACGIPTSNTEYWASTTDKTTITNGGAFSITKGQTIDGVTYKVNGILFVDKTDTTKRLFIPSACYLFNGVRYTLDAVACWTSSNVDTKKARYIFRGPNTLLYNLNTVGQTRFWGLTIRPVYVGR